ncbi:MAG: hypothetical protein ACFFD4_09295 [Candidatus Odinarchaeota archaeon]
MALKREKEAKGTIKALEDEKRLLLGIKYYYDNPDASYETIEESCGYQIRDLKRAMADREFPHPAFARNKKEQISETIDKRIAEIDREIFRHRESIFGSLDQLMIIPSWTSLMETRFKGYYRNQPVHSISNDLVLMLTHIAVPTFETTTGEPAFIITGAGIYWTKFSVVKDSIVTDYREINSIILPLETWLKAQESPPIVNTEILTYREHLLSIPFSLILSPETTQMYLRGVLARNVFHPFREALNQLVSLTNDEKAWSVDKGLRVLSGGLSSSSQLFTNEILVEKSDPGYMELIPGIKNIQDKLSKIEEDLQVGVYREELFEKMPVIKNDFSEVGHRLLTDWMPENL